ncbi:MAG: MBL fold metallo-hydrolase [Proteobacteria bacterium]|nr:MBL fold metallo-hydrolase [Pseudomonadota bacterium]MBU1736887.1 MBL fold metallo-hydrolase [Pseudomonadota bacterium]
MMQVKFWGVRGSIPCPGPDTVKYGGNTPCIELRIRESGRLIIIDAGSGIRELGNYMMAHDLPKGPIRAELFLTHTHWDHIMGYPFFTPIYIPGTEIRVCGPVNHEEDSLEGIVGGQMSYRYFPVRHLELAAKIKYTSLKEGKFDLGEGMVLTTKYLNHPVLCLGYRFQYKGKVFCTAYDTEPFQNLFTTDINDPSYDKDMAQEGKAVADEQNKAIEDFFKGVDVLVHDAQYTKREYKESRVGWGHSSIEHTVAAANRAGVKNLVLFHHEPGRSDKEIDRIAEELHAGKKWSTNLIFAREGMVIDV